MKICRILQSAVLATLAVGIFVPVGAAPIDSQGSPITVNGADTTAGGFTPGLKYTQPGWMEIGWTGQGGGNLSAFSKGHPARPGEFNFVFGGSSDIGKIYFRHYDGTNWLPKMALDRNGNLTVLNSVSTKEITVSSSVTWPDYVFKPGYELMPLDDLKSFITKEGHLPGIPTAKEVSKDGIQLGAIAAGMLEKVEELTLYVLQLQEQNMELRADMAIMNERIDRD